jgi:hypothetical protein
MYPADDTDVRLRFLLVQVRETIRRVADEVARARALHATLHELQGDIRKLSRRRAPDLPVPGAESTSEVWAPSRSRTA